MHYHAKAIGCSVVGTGPDQAQAARHLVWQTGQEPNGIDECRCAEGNLYCGLPPDEPDELTEEGLAVFIHKCWALAGQPEESDRVAARGIMRAVNTKLAAVGADVGVSPKGGA